jgi:cytochrome oxidase Cu insertion factor (SCO1/SenC/PrrC family)
MALCLYLFWTATCAVWVWLALSPVPETSPVWLLQTREVCFGTLDNGLPDSHGWISLAAPIPMLITLLLLMGQDLKNQMVQLARSIPGLLACMSLVLSPLAIGAYVGVRVAQAPSANFRPQQGRLPADYPSLNEACPAFSLVDQTGQAFGPQSLVGRSTLLTFAYAHCQTVCPGLIENLRQAGIKSKARVVVVTLDPRRDTCGSLEGLVRFWQLPPGSLMLGGQVEQVEAAIKSFEIPAGRDTKTGEITHPALVLLLDSKARLRYRFNSPSTEWLEEAVSRIEQAPGAI